MVLSLFSVLVLPWLFVAGYLVRLVGTAARAEQPAEYEEPWRLLATGALATVGAFLYASGTVVIVYAALRVNTTLASALTLAGCYLAPATVTTFAARGRLGPGEAVDRVLEFAFTRRYLLHFVGYVTVGAVCSVVGMFALFLLPFGFLLSPLASVPSAAYWGHVYGRALENGVVTPLPTDE